MTTASQANARRLGLTSQEAAARLARDGANVLPVPPGPPLWHQLAAQMFHFFALMLWAAGILAVIAGLPQLGVAIFAVVVLNGFFAFAQEYRAERAAERLRDLLPRRQTVVRDGLHLDIDARELVTGDLVVLAAGDRISADLEALLSHGLFLDTSTLTGESVPSPEDVGGTLFAGTFIVEGEGLAVVTATGTRTRLAGIAELTRSGRRPPSPLALELHRVVRTIAIVAMSVGVGFFGLALLLGTPARDGFLFAIGVTVALVPEGLLPTVTLSLAIGAQRMARDHALVRRLESVETLGSTTFICTDKTGTLTENRMSVVEVWTPLGAARVHGDGYAPEGTVDADNPEVRPLLLALARAARRCSTGHAIFREGEWRPQGDPMEAAIDAFAGRVGFDFAGAAAASPAPRRVPFDPRRRRMSVVTGDSVLVKGAPDTVVPRCPEAPSETWGALESMTVRGLRVIAVGRRPVGGVAPADAEAAESGLELLGLIGLEDPPRAAAAAAIASCRAAGIRVAMVTGDHPATARAIAAEVGLLGPEGMVVAGADLPQDEELLGALVDRDGIVISRVDPEDKLRIARALRRRGHVVAMTGDGVNDGPALQEADIGIAMGASGTDVAREAADLVLLDDNFATIVAAVVQGRSTFANIRRFLTYHLTDNVAELTPFAVWALSGGRFPLALGVLQILALDIGTDTLPALALGAEPPAARVLEQRPARGRLLNGRVARRAFSVLGPTEASVGMAAFLTTFLAAGWRPGDTFPEGATLLAASGAAFSAVVIGQSANAFACRSSSKLPGALGWFTNRFLVSAAAAELVFLAAFLGVPFLASLLDHAPPSAAGLAVAVLAAPAVLMADALDKAHPHRNNAPRGLVGR